MYWTGFHLLRRLAFAMTIAWMSQLVLQIEILTHSSLILTAYTIAVMPMISPSHNVSNCMNECFILFASYFILAFSSYNYDFASRVKFGWSYLGIIGLVIAISVFIAIF